MIFVAHQPVQILQYAGHDDAMFWSHAFQIISGNWLGEFSQMTLPKGAGFPLVESLGAVLGIPVQVFSALILIGSLLILVKALRNLKIPNYVLYSGFVLTLAQSALIMVRPLRDYLYASLTLVAVATVLEIVRKSGKWTNLKMGALGVIFGLFLITREEGVWILPSLIVILLGSIWVTRNQKRLALRSLSPLSFAAFGALTVQLVVMLVNLASYGTFTTQDFTFGAFPRALSAVQSVSTAEVTRHVPVTLEAREDLYGASPAFAELRDYFEGPGLGWAQAGCSIEGEPCGEYAGGWFMWALRDAVASRGYYESPLKATEYYSRLADEVEAACEASQLSCATNNISFIPRLSSATISEIPLTVQKTLDEILQPNVDGGPEGRSEGDSRTLFLLRAFLGSPNVMPAASDDVVEIQGWIHGYRASNVSVSCANPNDSPQLAWLPSPDLVQHFGDTEANKNRFKITYAANAKCEVTFGGKSYARTFEMQALTEDQLITVGPYQTYIESANQLLLTNPSQFGLDIKNGLTAFNRISNPIIFWFGLTALIGTIFIQLKRRVFSPVSLVIIPGLYILIFSRMLLVTFVSVTSFPAVNSIYLLPATIVLPFASLLAINALVTELREATEAKKSLATSVEAGS